MPLRDSGITVTDQFCGAGGSSQGARRLGLKVAYGLNHWELAVATHAENFPDTHHDCADLRVVHPGRYRATDILITSPECTNHSIAKGVKRRRGQLSLFDEEKVDPSAVRSRATMWTVPEYAEHHDYNLVIVENVVDARKWRPWDGWITAMRNLGYDHECVYFNSMFAHLRPLANPIYGDFAPQSRDRMYVVFWKRRNRAPDLEIRPLAPCARCGQVEAVQSWKKSPGEAYWNWGRYDAQYVYRCPHCAEEVTPYYYAAANAIDWSLPAERVGDRKKPLKKRTLERVRRGIEMFVGQHLVIDLAYTHGHDNRSVPVYRATLPTQTAANTSALLMLPFTIETLFTNGERLPKAVDEAMNTITTRQSQGVMLPPFLTVNYTPGYSKGVDEAMAAITTQDHHALIHPPFLLGYANGDGLPKDTAGALRTFHTENGQGLVVPPFVTMLRGTNAAKGADEALDTFAANGTHHALITPFLMSYYGGNANHRAVDRELGTVTTKDKHALVETAVDVEDCGFRMLQPHEIGRGMAFDDGYTVLGNKREKVRQYGNAVTPPVMQLILERCLETLK